MHVFFFRKRVLVWGIVLLIAIIVLIVLLRLTGGEAQVYHGIADALGQA